MVEKEFIALLNLSVSLDILELMGAQFAITDVLIDLCLLFFHIISVCNRTISE